MNTVQADTLVMPRNLAIRILHAAQVAAPQAVRGLIGARGNEPASFYENADAVGAGESLWAELWSHPEAPAIPDAAELHAERPSLVVSLNTKGVLEMRAWRLESGAPREIVLKIRD